MERKISIWEGVFQGVFREEFLYKVTPDERSFLVKNDPSKNVPYLQLIFRQLKPFLGGCFEAKKRPFSKVLFAL